MVQAGKILIFVGFIILLIGGVIFLTGRANISLGKLPGDIRIQHGNMTCLIPIVSSILISILLTLALNLLTRWLNR